MTPDSAAISLLDALSETGYESSVIATYCCYFPFYEEVVLRRLLDRGCTNNVLMVDAKICARAFADEHVRPRRAGRDYTLIPIHLEGAFHPKLIIMLGKSKGTLFVGSHNATLSGFGLNDEITNEFRAAGARGHNGAGVISAALNYLQGFAPKTLGDIARVVDAIRLKVPWLEGPVALESDAERTLLLTTGKDSSLWSRLRLLVPNRPSLAFVCGPFFDDKLEFLQQLVDDVKPKKLIVGIDPESVEIDPTAVRRFKGAEFVNIAGLAQIPNRRDRGGRYFHAKVLWFTAVNEELLVTGSANPSRAAFLLGRGRRNAEAIVVDRRRGAAKTLGLDLMISAPKLRDEHWDQVAGRQATLQRAESLVSGTIVLGVPSDDDFLLERSLGSRMTFDAFSANGKLLGETKTRTGDLAYIEASPQIRDTAQLLRGVGPKREPVVVLIHRPEEIAKNIGGDRQRELRKALGALEEDPSQLDLVLKLTEKVIFDSDEIVRDEPPIRAKSNSEKQEQISTGPKTLSVDAAGRRSARKHRRLASGDILVLLDLLMYRLGQGLSGTVAPRPFADEVRPLSGINDEDEPESPLPTSPPQYELLAEACRSKVGRLVKRMIRQLDASRGARARHAIVQLAAVLSVIYSLRIMEQRVEWRSKHLRLVSPEHEWMLFETAALATGWGGSALVPRALEEVGGQPFEEISLVIGLLVWLAWEVGIDVKVAVERANPINLEEEDAPWYAIQVFAAIAVYLSDDQQARDALVNAVASTPKRTASTTKWLETHFTIADHLASVMSAPETVLKPQRPPMPGDLIVLGTGFDPRVRTALDVAPSGTSDKITVLDPDHVSGERQFLASYVRYEALFNGEPTSIGLTAS